MKTNVDLDIDDILEEKKKKKGINSGRKGKTSERMLCKILNERFGGGFSRSIGSGNRWGQVSNLPSHAQQVFSGDLVCPVGFAFVLESKSGYDEIDLITAICDGNAQLDSFLEQVSRDSANSGRKPMLIWKKTRKSHLAFLRTCELPHTNWESRLIYKEWSAIPFDLLLKTENPFFFVTTSS